MKKSVILLFSFLFMSVASNAILTVTENGKISKYPAGSIVRIYSSQDVSIEYNGTTVSIPKNTRVTLREEIVAGARTLSVRGEDISGLMLGDIKVSAKGSILFSFNPANKQIEVVNGALLVTDKKGEPALYYKGDTFRPGKSGSSSPEATNNNDENNTGDEDEQQLLTQPNLDNDSSDKYQQASKNIEEERTLSSSTPV